MALPPVVVEIAAEEASAAQRGALVEACTRAVQDGYCVEGSSSTPGESAAAVAIVSWQPDGAIRIEVGLRSDEPWHTRILRFSAEEEPAEVFTALGFAIGALVGRLQEQEQQRESEMSPTPAPPPPPEPPARPPPAPVLPPRLDVPEPPSNSGAWVARMGLLGGTGRSWSTWRVGGGAGLAWRVPSGWFASVSGSYAATPRPVGEPRVSWAGVGLGPGHEWLLRSGWGVAAGAQLGGEYHRARVTLPDSGATASAGRVVGVGRLEIECLVPTRTAWGVALGTGVTVPFGVTRINVAGVPQAEPAPVRLTGMIGVRYDLQRRSSGVPVR